MSHTDDDGATASDVEGPLYVDDPPWREAPVRVYEDYEGMGDADVLFVRGSVDLGRRRRRCPTRSSTSGRPGPTAATTSGTSASPSSTSAGAGGSAGRRAPTSSRRCCRSPTPCRPRGRWGATWRRSASTRGGRRTSTSRSTRRGHEPLVTQVFFPDDPYLENDTIGAVKPALVRPGRARGRPPGLPRSTSCCGRRREPLRELRRRRAPLRGAGRGRRRPAAARHR